MINKILLFYKYVPNKNKSHANAKITQLLHKKRIAKF